MHGWYFQNNKYQSGIYSQSSRSVSAVRPRESGIVPDISVDCSKESVRAVRPRRESGIVPDN